MDKLTSLKFLKRDGKHGRSVRLCTEDLPVNLPSFPHVDALEIGLDREQAPIRSTYCTSVCPGLSAAPECAALS